MLNKIKCSPSFVLSLILLATFVSYIYSLQAGFVSWDDTVYVTDNIFIRHLSFHNLWKIFNEAILGVYSPLVTLTFAVEYYFFKLNPVVYHLDNVLLHLCVTAFVFWFGLEFGFSLLASTVAALIFGTHPMHVESVAWVSERKDVLYAFFYMLALVVYGKYLKTHRTDFYMFTIVLCFLSMLSKPMALSLPLVFCLLDWFTRREVSKKIFLEKIPHFLVVATIGLITYTYNARTLNVHPNEALLTWIWTSVFYIKKFFVPFFLVPLYELPHPISASQFSYAGSLLLFFSLMILGIYLRRNKYFLFSIFFYIVTMFFLFRFDDVIDRNIVADRFMYVPSLGFCLLLGRFFEVLIGRLDARRGLQQTIVLIGSLIFLLLFRATIHQTKIWKNNDVLWSYVIEKNPNSYFPYVSRANAYLEQGRYDLASTDTDRAIELKPDYSRAWHDKGIIFQQMGQYDLAMDYYTQALRLNPKLAVAFHNRGLLYFVKGDLDSALNAFN